ncbi:hypothetical protein GCM10010912_39020 [Paenibacillus albidus]|uniref:Uncharacterized protein n=1 Tax=Paenibacillus albidus TaxID=2041023 RepID=A0A917CLD7_9BACL|nr:hypothetical protein GCM10010912_39020 [Paenibacillus albidus]
MLEASDEISGAGGLGSISGVKRTEKTLFCEKVIFPGELGLRSRYIVRLSLECGEKGQLAESLSVCRAE